MARAGASASASPRSSSGNMTFSNAVSEGSSWKLWNTKPTFSPRTRARPSSSSVDIGAPSMSTLPPLGVSSPAINASSVVLPEPDAPTTATVSPRWMSKAMPLRMVNSPLGSGTRLPRSRTCSVTSRATCGGRWQLACMRAGSTLSMERPPWGGEHIGLRLHGRLRERPALSLAREDCMTPFNAASPRRLQWLVLNVLMAAVVLLGQAALVRPAQAGETSSTTPAPPVAADQRTVLVLGDSLSAGYGLEADQGWVPLTAQRVSQQRPGWRVVNASISGETTAGGAA